MNFIADLYQKYLDSTGITTDTRQIEPGNIFFALKGNNFDGNRYARQALDKGADYAIVDDEDLKQNSQFILVNDVLTTLQELANHHRNQFKMPIIGITGSNGKTTTKELMAIILSSHYRCHYTKGNLNNHIGVPLTLLSLPLDSEIAIIEMGANHIGEIAALCEIAEPTHGLITNIGKAHLEGFGGIEGVKKGKSELYNFLTVNNGVGFINTDEPFLLDLAKGIEQKVLYHQSQNPDPTKSILETKLISSEPTVKVAFLSGKDGQIVEVESTLFGAYNFNNIQTAIAIGRYFKVPYNKIKKAVMSYISKNNRSEELKVGSNIFLKDAYNANPTSMRLAIDNIAGKPAESRIVILGDMLELGDYSVAEHKETLKYALSKKFQETIVVGKEFANAAIHFSGVQSFDDVEELKDWFTKKRIQNTLILLKGSRGIRLEKLIS